MARPRLSPAPSDAPCVRGQCGPGVNSEQTVTLCMTSFIHASQSLAHSQLCGCQLTGITRSHSCRFTVRGGFLPQLPSTHQPPIVFVVADPTTMYHPNISIKINKCFSIIPILWEAPDRVTTQTCTFPSLPKWPLAWDPTMTQFWPSWLHGLMPQVWWMSRLRPRVCPSANNWSRCQSPKRPLQKRNPANLDLCCQNPADLGRLPGSLDYCRLRCLFFD